MNPTTLTDESGRPSPALSEWLARLEQLDPNRITLGLDRVATVFERLAVAAAKITITIAGTNGKGSSALLLDGLLRAAGHSVGRYTSPHLERFNERIVVNGESAGDDALVAAFERVERARGAVALSYFEFTTLAAFVVFGDALVDAWVLEIGLGGRLDAVNVVTPDACLLTSVGLDHQQWLGDDLDSIGREKAAIFRADTPAVIAPIDPPRGVIDVARAKDAALWQRGQQFDASSGASSWQWRGETRRIDNLPLLAGAHQHDNASACLAVLDALGLLAELQDDAIVAVLRAQSLPGRLELRPGNPQLLLDVAHNIDSVARLAGWLDHHRDATTNTLVFGAMCDKAVEEMLAPLSGLIDRWIAVQANGIRPMRAEEVARRMVRASGQPARVGGTPWCGYRSACEVTPADGRIVVAGSFPVVGAVRGRL